MAIITLTTDFGSKDPSVAAVKGAIYSEQIDNLVVVDITHEITPFDLQEAAYILKNAYIHFPKNTIHIIGVDSAATPETKHIALQLYGQFLIGADNGILSLIASEVSPEFIYQIELSDVGSSNFPVLDIFVKVACHLARGGSLSIVGTPIPELKKLRKIEPIIQRKGNVIIGSVIYIDNYGNVVTNISKDLFETYQKNRKFTIETKRQYFNTVVNKYCEVVNFDSDISNREDHGKKIALFNTSGLLEIAIYKSNPQTVGSASTLFGMKYLDTITVTFED